MNGNMDFYRAGECKLGTYGYKIKPCIAVGYSAMMLRRRQSARMVYPAKSLGWKHLGVSDKLSSVVRLAIINMVYSRECRLECIPEDYHNLEWDGMDYPVRE